MDENRNGRPLALVVAWESGVLSEYNLGFLNLDFVVRHPELGPQAHESPNFALTPAQLRELSAELLLLAKQLEINPSHGSGSPRH